jgi:hypothetical protein
VRGDFRATAFARRDKLAATSNTAIFAGNALGKILPAAMARGNEAAPAKKTSATFHPFWSSNLISPIELGR